MRFCQLAIAGLFTIGAASLYVRAADPTTHPAEHHAVSAPKDWVQIDSTVGMFEFAVPKKWGSGSKSDTADTFELPPPPAPKNDPNAKGPQASMSPKPSTFAVTVAKGKGTTLKAAADAARAGFSLDTDGNKIDADQATTLAGRPAWLLVTEEKYVAGSKSIPVTGKPDRVIEIKHPFKTYRIITVVGDNLYDVSFAADGGRYESGKKVADQVLDTFTWTGTAADDAK
jgi:hypothetical protein